MHFSAAKLENLGSQEKRDWLSHPRAIFEVSGSKTIPFMDFETRILEMLGTRTLWVFEA